MNPLKIGLVASIAMLAIDATLAAGPDGYPNRPVTVVVPFAPGGGSDNVARMIATRLTERTGGSFIIDNKPGSSSSARYSAGGEAQK